MSSAHIQITISAASTLSTSQSTLSTLLHAIRLITLCRKGRPAPLGILWRLSASWDIVEMILYNAKESEIAIFSGFEKNFIFLRIWKKKIIFFSDWKKNAPLIKKKIDLHKESWINFVLMRLIYFAPVREIY